jgi:S-formylglutathione hydrolase FrmB
LKEDIHIDNYQYLPANDFLISLPYICSQNCSMKQLLSLFFLILGISVFAGQADTILIHSSAMNKDIKCVVILPTRLPKTGKTDNSTQPSKAQAPSENPLPVLYLLHGYAGSYAQWPGLASQLTYWADEMQIIIVCPDGGFSSWYFDSPVDPSIRYETFISGELVSYIDGHYKTIPDRLHRAISGLSMGGHGALYLAIRHLNIYGAAGAMSGGVDFRPFPDNWDLKKDLGDFKTHKNNWDNNTVIHAVGALKNGDLALTFDCGVDDFFLPVNRELHKKLLELKIDHDYTERPGAHNSTYWSNSIDYQLIFFWKYFHRQ